MIVAGNHADIDPGAIANNVPLREHRIADCVAGGGIHHNLFWGESIVLDSAVPHCYGHLQVGVGAVIPASGNQRNAVATGNCARQSKTALGLFVETTALIHQIRQTDHDIRRLFVHANTLSH